MVEMAYKPRVTRLVRRAEEEGCVVVDGVSVLVEQAKYQFATWTGGCRAPQGVIERAVREELKRQEGQ